MLDIIVLLLQNAFKTTSFANASRLQDFLLYLTADHITNNYDLCFFAVIQVVWMASIFPSVDIL